MVNKEFNLQITGTPTEFGDVSELENYRFPNGKGFPGSYKEFALVYGYGLALEEFHIYLPMAGYGDSLYIRTEEIKSTYINDVDNNDIWFDLKPDGSADLLKRLFPFASSDNGLYLFWDYENDFEIYLTDFRGIGFRKVGKSMYEMIENLTGDNYRYYLPFSDKPLARTFKCLNRIECNDVKYE